MDARPAYSVWYRASLKARRSEKTEMRKLLLDEATKAAQTELATPIVFAPKKGGSVRFCVKKRNPNGVPKWDVSPMPHMDDCIDSFGKSTALSTTDGNS